jgi:hypothetical protein
MDKTLLAHGEYGEELVIEAIENVGWHHVGPIKDHEVIEEGAHDFDHLFYNQQNYFLADTKAKARMNLRPMTGINAYHFGKYINFHEEHLANPKYLGFFLFFADEHPEEEKMYCLSLGELLFYGLDELKAEGKIDFTVGRDGKDIILFNLSLMNDVKKLTVKEVLKLKALGMRHYGYR